MTKLIVMHEALCVEGSRSWELAFMLGHLGKEFIFAGNLYKTMAVVHLQPCM
jgi:hypothetical protein